MLVNLTIKISIDILLMHLWYILPEGSRKTAQRQLELQYL